MKTRNWGLAILAAGAVAAVTAGTIAPHGGPSTEPSSAQPGFEKVIPAATAKPGIINEVLGLLQEPKEVFNARTRVSNACMAAKGFPEFPRSGQADMPNDMRLALHGFLPLTVDRARQDAYRSVTNIETGGYLVGDTVAEGMQNAYWGFDKASGKQVDSTGGCRGAGLVALYGSLDAQKTAEDASQVLNPAILSANHDHEFSVAVHEWSQCMADSGYPEMSQPGSTRRPPVADSTAANKQGQHEPAPVDPTSKGPETRKLAVADVLCRDKTGLVQHLDDVLARYLTTAVEQHSDELAKVKTIRDAAAARASSLSK